MTARDRILAKPEAVQIVLRACMTKESIDDPSPDWEHYGVRALEWWAAIVSKTRQDGSIFAEEELARDVIERMRKQEVWGKILREGAN